LFLLIIAPFRFLKFVFVQGVKTAGAKYLKFTFSFELTAGFCFCRRFV